MYFQCRSPASFKTKYLVAVTRAQALLVVIGDPIVLALDPLWREFINYVHVNGGFKGYPIDWNPEDPVDYSMDFARNRREQGLAEVENFIMEAEALDLGDKD